MNFSNDKVLIILIYIHSKLELFRKMMQNRKSLFMWILEIHYVIALVRIISVQRKYISVSLSYKILSMSVF